MKDIVLLDCTHMFHKCCIESFERFDIKPVIDAYRDGMDDGSGLQSSPLNKHGKNYGHACPICRHQNYKKV